MATAARRRYRRRAHGEYAQRTSSPSRSPIACNGAAARSGARPLKKAEPHNRSPDPYLVLAATAQSPVRDSSLISAPTRAVVVRLKCFVEVPLLVAAAAILNVVHILIVRDAQDSTACANTLPAAEPRRFVRLLPANWCAI